MTVKENYIKNTQYVLLLLIRLNGLLNLCNVLALYKKKMF